MIEKMEKLTHCLSVSELLFCSAFVLLQLNFFLGAITATKIINIDTESIREVCQLLSLLLLFVKAVFYQHASLKQWIIVCMLTLLGFLTWFTSSDGWFFWTIIFIVCGQGQDIHKLATCSLAVLIPCFVIVVALAGFGVIENVVTIRDNGTVRYSMGFSHSNGFGLMLLAIAISFCLFRFGKKLAPQLLVIAICLFLCLEVANSRSSALCLFVLAVVDTGYYLIHNQKTRQAITLLIGTSILFVALGSFLLMVVYDADSNFYSTINSILSNRIALANRYYLQDSLTLFGRDYTDAPLLFGDGSSDVTFLVDNAYCHVILHFGILAYVVLIATLVFSYIDAVRTGKWDASCVGLAVFFVYAFVERYGLMFCYNYCLISFSDLLFSTFDKDAVSFTIWDFLKMLSNGDLSRLLERSQEE